MTPISHAADLWTLDDPDQVFYGLRFGTRATLVRLPSGGLLVHSPIRLTADLKAQVDALGVVEHIVAPSLYHHLYAGEWAAAWEGARLHLPAALKKKRKDLAHGRELDSADPDWGDAVEALPFDGFKLLSEVVLFHRPSGTLITSDMMQNVVDVPDHWFTRSYLGWAGIRGKPGMSKFLAMAFNDKAAARGTVQRILEWDFDRVIVGHGAVLPSGGKDAFAGAYAFLPDPA